MKKHDDIKCPVCRRQYLDAYEVDGVTVDQCPRCKGVWYDKGEYAKLVSVAVQGLQIDKYGATSKRYCPRDDDKLVQMEYPQTLVQIDMCPTCNGIWLDKQESDEIQQVRRHLRRVGKIERFAPIPGIKGDLIRWINLQIDRLTEFDYEDL